MVKRNSATAPIAKILFCGPPRGRAERMNAALADAAADGWRVRMICDTAQYGLVVLVEREARVTSLAVFHPFLSMPTEEDPCDAD